ncbi:hypothetical protein D3C76_397540 [compost metagenome]
MAAFLQLFVHNALDAYVVAPVHRIAALYIRCEVFGNRHRACMVLQRGVPQVVLAILDDALHGIDEAGGLQHHATGTYGSHRHNVQQHRFKLGCSLVIVTFLPGRDALEHTAHDLRGAEGQHDRVQAWHDHRCHIQHGHAQVQPVFDVLQAYPGVDIFGGHRDPASISSQAGKVAGFQ